MGKCRNMGAGLAGSSSRSFRVNVNQIQFGDRLQGLPPMMGIRRPSEIYRSRAGGNAPGRFRLFCINQLGNVGFRNKGSQFASNADGVRPCPSKYWPPRAEKSCLTDAEIKEAKSLVQTLRENLSGSDGLSEYDVAFVGDLETVLEDIAAGEHCSGCSAGTIDPIYKSLDYDTESPAKDFMESGAAMINRLNELVRNPSCRMNASGNGGCAPYLGFHQVALVSDRTARNLRECGYGASALGTRAYASAKTNPVAEASADTQGRPLCYWKAGPNKKSPFDDDRIESPGFNEYGNLIAKEGPTNHEWGVVGISSGLQFMQYRPLWYGSQPNGEDGGFSNESKSFWVDNAIGWGDGPADQNNSEGRPGYVLWAYYPVGTVTSMVENGELPKHYTWYQQKVDGPLFGFPGSSEITDPYFIVGSRVSYHAPTGSKLVVFGEIIGSKLKTFCPDLFQDPNVRNNLNNPELLKEFELAQTRLCRLAPTTEKPYGGSALASLLSTLKQVIP